MIQPRISLPTRNLGNRYEEKTKLFLEQGGVTLMDANFTVRCGEIDLIGVHGQFLVFFEVRFRSGVFRQGIEAVDFKKLRRIRRVAQIWMQRYADILRQSFPCVNQVRIDLVAWGPHGNQWIKNIDSG